MSHLLKRLVVLCTTLGALNTASAQALPPEVADAFARARVPLEAVSLLVTPADATAPSLLSHRASVPVSPASVIKLVTTFAALELLGPGFTWRTPVWIDGKIDAGVLKGNLIVQGQGDPKLVVERLWLLLRRVQALGVHTIDGDIVLDRSAFATPITDPGAFDGEPLRPYNASADALLINFKSIVMTFTPDLDAGLAHVQIDPPLWGVNTPTSVALANGANGACGDYRATLRADWSDPQRIHFDGHYPAVCGEKVWAVAYSDPASYNARVVRGLWRDMGGLLLGQVREGLAPRKSASFALSSPSLVEVIRDINKFSNNVMAQQLFLTLGLPAPLTTDSAPSTPEASLINVATPDSARDAMRLWWLRRIGTSDAPTIDSGSGLSRQTRISAQQLGQLLQLAYASPFMPELMASLPIVGIDGTLKRSQASVASAHLKTGSLKDVLALAGYVHAADGRQICLVAIVNHPHATAARPALDALVDWAAGNTQPQ